MRTSFIAYLVVLVLALAPGAARADPSGPVHVYATNAEAVASCNFRKGELEHAAEEVGGHATWDYACASFIDNFTGVPGCESCAGYLGHLWLQGNVTTGELFAWTTDGEDEENDCSADAPASFFGSVERTASSSPYYPGQVACRDGCEYYGGDGHTVGGNFVGTLYKKAGSGGAAGVACDEGAPVVGNDGNEALDGNQACVPIGTLTQCYDATSGKLCAVTPRGAKACWSPGETGPKVSPDQKEALSKTEGTTPPTPPETLHNAESHETEQVTQSSASATPSSTTYVITYSNATGTPGTATSGSSSSGNGTGSSPAGNGSGTGSGTGDGAGSAGDGVGDGLYEGVDGKTYGSILSAHLDAVQETPLVSGVSGFFEVTIPTSSCPALELPHWEFLGHSSPEYSFTWHCSGTFHSVLVGVGVFLLIAAAWAAFRWAFGET